jgi:hypothetical protein
MTNLRQLADHCKSEDSELRLESEIRRSSTLEQHFVHGKWEITKIYVNGDLHEIAVKCRDESHQ